MNKKLVKMLSEIVKKYKEISVENMAAADMATYVIPREKIDWTNLLKCAQEKTALKETARSMPSFRVFTQQEELKISKTARGMLMSLTQLGVIKLSALEMCIDVAMELKMKSVTEDEMSQILNFLLLGNHQRFNLKNLENLQLLGNEIRIN
jgi:uncharacterized protein Smg (DUF494 family)